SQKSFQTFYDEIYPFIVEYVVRDKENLDAFSYSSTVLNTEAYKIGSKGYLNANVTFDKMMAYNNHQVSGLLDFVDTGGMPLVEKSMERPDMMDIDFKERIWKFANIYDRAKSDSAYLLENTMPQKVNIVNI